MKPVCYVVPIEAALESIRVAAVELNLNLHPPLLSLWFKKNRPTLSENDVRYAMSHPVIRVAVWSMEQQLFARLLRDIYLVTCENIRQNDSIYLLRHRLRHHHQINEETLFRRVFEEYIRFKDLPTNLNLGYNGTSLFLQV